MAATAANFDEIFRGDRFLVRKKRLKGSVDGSIEDEILDKRKDEEDCENLI